MESFTIEVLTWINGAPTVKRTIEASSRDAGVRWLRDTGHYQDYDVNHCAKLYDGSRVCLATLHIFGRDRWRVEVHDGGTGGTGTIPMPT